MNDKCPGWWGCEPGQTPTGPGESIRLAWNPLGSTFNLQRNIFLNLKNPNQIN